jgi:adenosylcobinamide kinase/adenosylcobinamide-phosphate guanylyltransferase
MSVGLVLGGVRSGKSRFATKVGRELSPRPLYVATSRRMDDDHARRIERHRRERGQEWQTVEEEKALASVDVGGRVVVVDCVTMWLTNLFLDAKQEPERALSEARSELGRCFDRDATWLFVSNEVGLGMRPTSAAERRFADIQGFVNQHIAARADWVVLLVAGIAVPVKGSVPAMDASGVTSRR